MQISSRPVLFLNTDTDLGSAGFVFFQIQVLDFSGINSVMISVGMVSVAQKTVLGGRRSCDQKRQVPAVQRFGPC